MATIFSHALAGSAIVAVFPEKHRSQKNYILAALTDGTGIFFRTGLCCINQ